MNKYFLILLISTAGCVDSINQEKIDTINISDLNSKFSGKKFAVKEGAFNKSKIRVLILDRHNWPHENSIINSRLKENNHFATDTAELKTVVLVYEPKLRGVLLDKPETDSILYTICFITTDSMFIRKMIDCKLPLLYAERESILANKIIKELSEK